MNKLNRQSRGRHRRIQGHRRGNREVARRGRRIGRRQLCFQQDRRGRGRRGDHQGRRQGDRGRQAMCQRPPTHRDHRRGDQGFGQLDILVNNSGVYGFAPHRGVTEEDFHRHFNVNVLGLLLATQAAVKHLGEGRSIINIGSVVSRSRPRAARSTRAPRRGGCDHRRACAELGPRKIRVNALNPGMVETEGTTPQASSVRNSRTASCAQTPLGRIGQPDDIASIAFPRVGRFALAHRRAAARGRRHALSARRGTSGPGVSRAPAAAIPSGSGSGSCRPPRRAAS